jgi:deoxyribonuclease-4
MARFGIHLSISGGVAQATARARELGCDAFQIFSRNPRTLKAKPIDPDDAVAFRAAVRESGIHPVVIHVNYLINVASPKDGTYELSVAALTDELVRADALGAELVVMHPGNHLGSGIEAGVARIASAIDRAYESTGAQARLCLENMAGAGTEIGTTFAELRMIMDLARRGPALGVCFDTCHAYGAGYDVSTACGLRAAIEQARSALGIDRIVLVHANDSKGQLGSSKDRHEHIGDGAIGLPGFRNILACPELADLPFILETPVDSPEDQARDLAAIRSCAPQDGHWQLTGRMRVEV